MSSEPSRNFRRRKAAWSSPLADLVGAVIDPVLARQGFSQSDLILYWDEIAGERLASMSQPIKLQWPRTPDWSRAPQTRGERSGGPQRQDAATLVVRVESGFALEMQHLAGALIDRVNAHLGWRCVGRIALKQGPVERRRTGRRAAPAPDQQIAREAERIVAGIEDDPLRSALARLGANILARCEGPAKINSAE
ncbi:DUF721 domain-containing protein [Methylocapsa palsarum]|uniref:DUF721 domain-containing protein n=1 Tax=Methylocapsa palsarum TaxID=1612308 RepID=A0A1I3Z4J2_9HYPH|nr:DciA family protein [Methylocapsa palsarum]SFK38992.1 hypothetical protein SAMN05444581_10770 [Methylocapsa palsarum]